MTQTGYSLKELSNENIKSLLGVEIGCSLKDVVSNPELLIKMGFEFAIVYKYDSVLSDRIENIRIDCDSIIEGRFLNGKAEIRIFCDGESLSGSIFCEKENSKTIERYLLLYPRNGEKSGYAEKLKVKKYIFYDDDKQAFISYVKPSKLIFKE